MSSFVWLTHQVPVSKWTKAEIAAHAPHLALAYSRPGLTTYKLDGKAHDDVELPSSFARAFGISRGRATTPAELASLMPTPAVGQKLRLHVWERDIDVPVDEQDAAARGTRAQAVHAAIRAAFPDAFYPDEKAALDDLVLDVVVPHATLPDEPWFIGSHRHSANHGPYAGGVGHVPLPPGAPSRAWCKIEEAMRWADLYPVAGHDAVELGSSPGGASYALLCRGVNVYGVDPGEMDPACLNFRGEQINPSFSNRFFHLHHPAAEVPKRDVPPRYQWLASDVNLAPMVALRYIERFTALAHGGLRGAFLTLKLNDDGVFTALPRILERIGKLGPTTMRVTQLPSHRSEVVAILTFG